MTKGPSHPPTQLYVSKPTLVHLTHRAFRTYGIYEHNKVLQQHFLILSGFDAYFTIRIIPLFGVITKLLNYYIHCWQWGGLFLKKTLPSYAFVRLPDIGRIKQPKHVVAKYSKYIIFPVLGYSDPSIDTDFIFDYLETCNISEGKIYHLHSDPFCYTTLVRHVYH
jgi:hypothetical protein